MTILIDITHQNIAHLEWMRISITHPFRHACGHTFGLIFDLIKVPGLHI